MRSQPTGSGAVSHERIYQHIWQDKAIGGTLYKHLRIGKVDRSAAETVEQVIVALMDMLPRRIYRRLR